MKSEWTKDVAIWRRKVFDYNRVRLKTMGHKQYDAPSLSNEHFYIKTLF